MDFFWERGAQTTWQALETHHSTPSTTYGLWTSEFFAPFKPLDDLFADDLAGGQAFVRGAAAQLNFGLLTEVSSTTYRTDQVMLSTALDYRPGTFGDQTHISQATLSESAIVFVTNPKNEPFTEIDRFPDADGYWTGYGAMPRAVQVGATSIQIFAPAYAPPDGGPLEQFTYIPVTHAYFPTEHFDEVVQRDGWTFGREGDGYVAVYSVRPAEFVDPVPPDIFTNGLTEPFDLRADGGADNVWIVEVGDAQRWNNFSSFQEAILNSTYDIEPRPATDAGLPGGYDVRWESPAEGLIEFGTTGPLMVNGLQVPLRHEMRFDNPYAQVAFSTLIYEIRDDEGGMVLDFDSRIPDPRLTRPPWGSVRLVHRGDHLHHHLLHGLQRPLGADHHLELDDLAVVVAGDDVDTVDLDIADLRLELQDGMVSVEHPLDVAEAAPTAARQRFVGVGRPGEHPSGRREIHLRHATPCPAVA